MNPEAAYQFLKPSLDQMTDQEKKALSELIGGIHTAEPVVKSRAKDKVWTVQQMKKKLLKTTHFKSKKY